MIDEKILTQKLKYLILMELKNEFEIINFGIDFGYKNYETKEELWDYDVDIKFDYNGVIDNDVHSMWSDINRMCGKVGDAVSKYGISKYGKIDTSGENLVSEALIWNIEYSADQSHIFNISFRVNFQNNE